jgi:hypothetical protein
MFKTLAVSTSSLLAIATLSLAADRPAPVLGIPCKSGCGSSGIRWNDPLTLCDLPGNLCCPSGSRGWFGQAVAGGPYWASICCPNAQKARWNTWKTALECYTPQPPCSPGGLEPCGDDL